MREAFRGVHISPTALERLRSIQRERGLEDCALRFYISGGCGCSPQIAMAFDREVHPYDHVFQVDGLKVVVDRDMLAIVDGARVDFVQTPMGEGFTIELPPQPVHAEAEHQHTCGCGDGRCGCSH